MTVASFILKHKLLFIGLCIQVVLLARNPYSERTLIPALDPFPDSIHYTNTAFNLFRGKGFVIEREGRITIPDVPVLYPLTLVPALFLFQDVRAFYFANVLLSMISFALFYRVVRRTFTNWGVQALVLLLYATNLTLAWYPTVAMAENLVLVLFMLALNLMIEKPTLKKSLLMGLTCVAFYATKYASLPLAAAFFFLYLGKLIVDVKSKEMKKTLLIAFLATVGITVGAHEAFEYIVKRINVLTQIWPLFYSVFFTAQDVPVEAAKEASMDTLFFSKIFIKQNLSAYTRWLHGQTLFIMWRPTQILSPLLAWPAFFSMFAGIIRPQWRYVIISLLVSSFAVLSVMMTFYVTDGRYFYTAFPVMFLAVGFALTLLLELIEKRIGAQFAYVLIGLFIVLYGWQNLLPLKSAVMLNLRYAETPWAYIAVKRLDAYLELQAKSDPQRPVVISPLSPYYVDYFTTQKPILLPLSVTQETREDPKLVWGDYNYKDLEALYTEFLENKTPVYFATYGIGNELPAQEAQKNLHDRFNLEEVDTGCHNLCNIYRLTLK